MNKPTHMVGAAAAGAGLAALTGAGLTETLALVGGALAADRIPDQDRFFDDSPKHRSMTHSLVLGGGAAVAAALLLQAFAASVAVEPGFAAAMTAFGLGLPAGYLAHLLLDSLTPERIWLLLPGGPRFGPGFMEVGSIGEGVVFLALCGAGGAALMSGLGGL